MSPSVTTLVAIVVTALVLGGLAWGVHRTEQQLAHAQDEADTERAAALLVRQAEAATEAAWLDGLLQLPDARKDQT